MTIEKKYWYPLPTVQYLNECLDYDPITGELLWRQRPLEHFRNEREWKKCNSRYAETSAGGSVNGYRKVKLSFNDKRVYRIHRIIWKMMTGEDPVDEVDHIDRDRSNNRWANLRIATATEQRWNTRCYGSSGIKGVGEHGRGWRALIRIDGYLEHLGTFSTPEEASAAFEKVAEELHGDFYYNKER